MRKTRSSRVTSSLSRTGRAVIAVTTLAVVSSVLATTPAGASGALTLTPDTVLDSTAPSAKLTLREAFLEASTVGSSAPSFVTIRLAAGQEYRLDNCADGTLLHNDTEGATILLDGRGARIRQTCPGKSVIETLGNGNYLFSRITISGGGDSGIKSAGSSLLLTDSTVENNSTSTAGGGIQATGDLHLLRSIVRNNTAIQYGGGVFGGTAGTQLTVTDSTVSSNSVTGTGGGFSLVGTGGGIVAGFLVVERSTIAFNSASVWGGGIAAVAGATITDSTVSSNAAATGAGVIADFNLGIAPNHPLIIVNSTISSNVASSSGGGVVGMLGPLMLNAVTFQNNYAAAGASSLIAPSSGDVTITNTVFGTAFGSTGCVQYGAPAYDTFIVHGNFEVGDSCRLDPASNVVNGGNPQLGPLASNGGPTRTHLPISRSPLVNRAIAVAACPAMDQRGTIRPQGGVCDIGAVER